MERAVQIFAAVNFLVIGLKGISRVSMERSKEFVVAGLFLLALGLFLVWLVVRG